MKNFLFILLFAMLSMLRPEFIKAQFDDLYAVPIKKKISIEYDYSNRPQHVARTIERTEIIEETVENKGGGRYEDEYYENEYYDEYDLGYTRRIYRFHRPTVFINSSSTWGWYDPFWDPFWGWGRSGVFVSFNTGWGWNSWSRWGNWGCPTWGWNSWNTGWGLNSWAWGGNYGNNIYINNNYYGNNWNNGWNNSWNNGTNKNAVYGSRRTSSTVSGTRGRADSPRIVGNDPSVADTKLTEVGNLTSQRSNTSSGRSKVDAELPPQSSIPSNADITGKTPNSAQSTTSRDKQVLRGEDPRSTSRSSIYSRRGSDIPRNNGTSIDNRESRPYSGRNDINSGSSNNSRNEVKSPERMRTEETSRSNTRLDNSRNTAPSARSSDRSSRGSMPSIDRGSSRSTIPSRSSMRSSGGGSYPSGSMRSSGGSGGSSRSSGGSSRRGG